ELDETQKRLWVALQNSNVAVWDYDIKEKCIIQNMNSQDVHGFEKIIKNVPESLIESGYVHPNSVKEFREFYNEILEAKPKITHDILVKNANDKGYWWERMIYMPVFDNDGNHIKSIGTSIDVSYQKNIEEKYQEELAYRENLTDSSLIAFMRVNITKGEIEEHSSKYTAKSIVDGLSYDSAVEMIVENTIDLGEREKMINTFKAEFLQKAYNEGKTEVSVECLRFVKPKRKIWVRCIAKLANLPNSSDIIAFIYTYNIHDEKVLKDIVTHAINKVYDLIMYIDVENQIFTIYREDLSEPTVFLNSDDAAHELAPKNAKIEGAIDSEEVLSKVSLATIQRELENNDAYIFSIKIKDDNGKSSVKRMHYSYLNEQKEVIILIRSDITDVYKQEKIQKEMILQALASAEQANKAKSTFLSSMSHDIRTPMNAIVGMAELASEDIDNKEKVKEYLEVINSSSQHLLALINDVLDMSKIESGAIVLASDRLSLIDEVNNISSMLKNMFDKKEQKFIVKTTNIIHDCLLGDVLRINRIFINLLNNASKFTPNGGEIRFFVEEYPSGSDKIAKFRFTVSDSGRGISKDKLSKIFEPFYRDGVSSITRIEGTGLGLSIVKNIVKAKGGNIKVTSEVNKGTTFVVDLPMHIATECNVKKAITHESVVKPHISHDFNGLKVLLVEDHPVNIVVAQKILEKFGAVVEVAENGKIA
ncbi:MAG: ATP-binding protein, partial [Oscillospiraceae bacterium]